MIEVESRTALSLKALAKRTRKQTQVENLGLLATLAGPCLHFR